MKLSITGQENVTFNYRWPLNKGDHVVCIIKSGHIRPQWSQAMIVICGYIIWLSIYK